MNQTSTLLIIIKYYLTLILNPNKLRLVKEDVYGRGWVHKMDLNELIMRHKSGESVDIYLIKLFCAY